ncbi:MAG: hypothetical protein ACI9OJ_003806 [Myxococcota bacterium]|jgi:hypothetical protein
MRWSGRRHPDSFGRVCSAAFEESVVGSAGDFAGLAFFQDDALCLPRPGREVEIVDMHTKRKTLLPGIGQEVSRTTTSGHRIVTYENGVWIAIYEDDEGQPGTYRGKVKLVAGEHQPQGGYQEDHDPAGVHRWRVVGDLRGCRRTTWRSDRHQELQQRDKDA